MLLKRSFPAAALCDSDNINREVAQKLSEWRTLNGLNGEVITLATILGLVLKRPMQESDFATVLPGTKLAVSDILKKKSSRVVANFLAPDAIGIALSAYPHLDLFHRILSNQVLPDYFPRTIQCHDAYEKSLSLTELENDLGIKSGGKRPEGKCIIKWCAYFGINSENGMRLHLDRSRVSHYLVYSIKKVIEKAMLDGETRPFAEMRSLVLSRLNLRSSFPFDQIFEILLRSQKKPAFSFKGGRSSLSGAWKGRPDFSFFSLTRELDMPSYHYVKSVSDRVDLELGA
jgi:hypothetical protein